MRKLILIAALLLVLGLGNVYAVPVTINVDEIYDWGRLYSFAAGVYTTTNSNPAYFGGGSDTPVGTAFPADTSGIGDGEEDTWGIGTIASIKTIPGASTVWERTGGGELTIMFWGFDDDYLSSPSGLGSTNIASTGGHISIYLDTTPDFDGTVGTGGRTGAGSFNNVTDGILVLDLIPVAFDLAGHTLESNFNLSTFSGAGAMYLATSGLGAWDSLYNTNTQLFGSDFLVTFTARPNSPNPIGDWVVRGDAGGEGDVVPEPTSMLLFGVGIVGLATLGKKKKAA